MAGLRLGPWLASGRLPDALNPESHCGFRCTISPKFRQTAAIESGMRQVGSDTPGGAPFLVTLVRKPVWYWPFVSQNAVVVKFVLATFCTCSSYELATKRWGNFGLTEGGSNTLWGGASPSVKGPMMIHIGAEERPRERWECKHGESRLRCLSNSDSRCSGTVL